MGKLAAAAADSIEGEQQDAPRVSDYIHTAQQGFRSIRSVSQAAQWGVRSAAHAAQISAPIAGAFGGHTIQEELEAIHGRLYDYTVYTFEEEQERSIEGGGTETIVVTRQEIQVTTRSTWTLLRSPTRHGR